MRIFRTAFEETESTWVEAREQPQEQLLSLLEPVLKRLQERLRDP